jgi:hypothetical protein
VARTKDTYKLNPLGQRSLEEALQRSIEDEDREDDAPKRKTLSWRRRGKHLGVDAKTAKLILSEDHAANFKTWRDSFRTLVISTVNETTGEAICAVDLTDQAFKEKYCDRVQIKKTRNKARLPEVGCERYLGLKVSPTNPESERYNIAIDWPEGSISSGISQQIQEPMTRDQLRSVLVASLESLSNLGVAPEDLIVEIFLPIGLMSLEIDRWEFPVSRSESVWIGALCKAIHIRSYERNFTSEFKADKGRRSKYWQQVGEMTNPLCGQSFPQVDNEDFQWDQFDPKRIGCWFVESVDQARHEAFWVTLLGRGIPIALWARQPVVAEDAVTAINAVAQCSVLKLPTSLSAARRGVFDRQSRGTIEPGDAGIEALSLLWDDPSRSPDLLYVS